MCLEFCFTFSISFLFTNDKIKHLRMDSRMTRLFSQRLCGPFDTYLFKLSIGTVGKALHEECFNKSNQGSSKHRSV